MLGVATGLLFAVNQVAIAGDLESAIAARDQDDFVNRVLAPDRHRKTIYNCLRQTGGARKIGSLHAEFNRNAHAG